MARHTRPRHARPHEFTQQEVIDLFLQQLRSIADYWAELPGQRSVAERIDGAIFSTLVVLDGGSIPLPAFTVTPAPHESDAAFHRARGESWFPDNVDIAGGLHEQWAQTKPRRQ